MRAEMFAPLRGPDARAIRNTLQEAIQYCAEGEADHSVTERLGVMWAATWWAEAKRKKAMQEMSNLAEDLDQQGSIKDG